MPTVHIVPTTPHMNTTPAKTEVTRQFEVEATMQTASGYVTSRAKGITVKVVMHLPFDNENGNIRGAWEIWSTKDGGNSIYGEGILNADSDLKVYDYDGCYDLCREVKQVLTEMGYDTTEL